MIMTKETKIIEFISFCVEIYAEAKGLLGKEVMDLFERTGLLVYLSECYDMLHSMGKVWLLQDLDSFLKNRNEGL